MTDKELEVKWNELEDIPFNEDDELDVDWWVFDKGTDRNHIWDYFDEKHSKGVAYLLELS